jgi:hypothetical protein
MGDEDIPVSASDLYDTVTFNDPSDFYNKEAPAPFVAFLVGGILTGLTVVYWYVRRWRPFMARLNSRGVLSSCVTLIATLSDNDDAEFTVLRVAAQSMLFLGGFQLHYEWTFLVMLIYYTVISLSDTFRVLISISSLESLEDLAASSKRDRSSLKSTLNMNTHGKLSVELKGGNVYEDITKPSLVVFLVFFTQATLISLIGLDIHNTSTQTTLDRTSNVPVVGTMGSWLVYVLGIFMQCVYILGPKQNFGSSEQNPHFWIKAFLAVKETGAICSWFDPLDDKQKEMELSHNDLRLWIPFFMSFLINGVGFHILVHALPIQVAAQSTLSGIVIRAVGMMYLVDLDDAPGTIMKFIEKSPLSSGDASNDDNHHLDVNKKREPSTSVVPPMPEESPRSVVVASTPEEALERARLQAEQIQKQLQQDLDAFAARTTEKKPIHPDYSEDGV